MAYKSTKTEKTCTLCLETKPIKMFRPHFVKGKRRGWYSRCRRCLHIISKQREKEKRQPRIQLRRILLELDHGREQTSRLEKRLYNAATSLEKRKRFCKFCGSLFTVGKRNKKHQHRPRLCPTCIPFQDVSSRGKFSRIVRQIIKDEDMQAISRLLVLFKDRSTKRYTANGVLSVSIGWFLRQLLKQNFRCAVCKNKFPNKRLPNIDHNHATGQIRGLLCGNCNHGLGFFSDSPDILASASKYLWSCSGHRCLRGFDKRG